jgi:hypothetical protein
VRNHIDPFLGTLKAEGLQLDEDDAFCRGLGATTIRQINFLLSGAYNRAKKRWKWVTHNSLEDAELSSCSPWPRTAAPLVAAMTWV